GLSFLSYVYPAENWSLALYRHELANFAANFNYQGAFLEETRSRSPTGIPGEYDGRLASLRNRMELEVMHYGVAAAYRWNPTFSAGVSLSYYRFSMDSQADRFVPPLREILDFNDQEIDSKVVSTQRQLGDDSDWGVNLGFLWQGGNRVWSIGGVYRRGAGFDVATVSERGSGPTSAFARFENEARFHIPEAFGIGFSCKPTDSLRIAFDYNYIKYSDMTRGFGDVFGLESFI
ncbi:MAG: hypothetical protein GY854_19180, partial [Deltaproteobacteria bacterium]|nr:hypothetical protein [Deltaproteobacteria bacterium]